MEALFSSMSNKCRTARDRIVESLKRELLGPSDPQESIREYPTSRYIVGRLAPAKENDDDTDAVIDPAENDSLGAGAEN